MQCLEELVKRLRYASKQPPMSGPTGVIPGEPHLERVSTITRGECAQIADLLESLRASLTRVEEALKPFAALATEEGRAPYKLDSIDPYTTQGLSIDHSNDDAQFAIRLRVGDIRAAAQACLSRASGKPSGVDEV